MRPSLLLSIVIIAIIAVAAIIIFLMLGPWQMYMQQLLYKKSTINLRCEILDNEAKSGKVARITGLSGNSAYVVSNVHFNALPDNKDIIIVKVWLIPANKYTTKNKTGSFDITAPLSDTTQAIAFGDIDDIIWSRAQK